MVAFFLTIPLLAKSSVFDHPSIPQDLSVGNPDEWQEIPLTEEMTQFSKRFQAGAESKLDPEIDGRRFFRQETWENALSKGVDPWLAHGEEYWNDLVSRQARIRDLKIQFPVTDSLLKEIHQIITERFFFGGFEYRRLHGDFLDRKLSQESFFAKKKEMRSSNKKYSGIDHDTLRGRYRFHYFEDYEFMGHLPFLERCSDLDVVKGIKVGRLSLNKMTSS